MMLRPLIRPIVRPLVRRVTAPGYGSLAAQIRLLFAAGEQGAWYDPSDLSSMNTKHDGSGAVPGVGDPVGYIADKSGRGNHAKQTTDTARPTLQLDSGRYYLQFDGVDDSLSTAAFLGGASDHLMVIGMRHLGAGAAWACLSEWGASPAMNAGFLGLGRFNATNNATTRVDTADSPAVGYNQTLVEPGGGSFNGLGHVVSGAALGSVDTRSLRVDGVSLLSSTIDGPVSDFSALPRAIKTGKGSAYSGAANVNIYGLIFLTSSAAISQAQIEAVERYAAVKTGVTLA